MLLTCIRWRKACSHDKTNTRQLQVQIHKYKYKIANTKPSSGYVTHVYPVEKGFSPIATLSCWSLMFLPRHKIKTQAQVDGWMG